MNLTLSQSSESDKTMTACDPKVEPTIIFLIFWEFLLVEQIFLSALVKISLIISNTLVYMSCLASCRTT